MKQEETLDPENWSEMRELGHQMIDDMFNYLQSIRDQKVWVPIPENIKSNFDSVVPHDPTNMKDVYQEFLKLVLPYKEGNIHPRFWGWVEGTGSLFGMLAELLAAGINPNSAGGEHGATYVENQVINWFKEIFDFPTDSSGIIVSGGSMANLVGLTVVRNYKVSNIREDGFTLTNQNITIYGSVETHSSIQKAVELLGLGNKNFRKIPVDDQYRIDIQALKNNIIDDKKNGFNPICIVGNAGTTNTGAIDDLDALADICKENDLWFHIDGAFGSLVVLHPSLKNRVYGLERADSLAFDFHKWMYIQYEAGCVLIRNKSAHYKSFTLSPDYLVHTTRGLAAGEFWYSDFGFELSRGFRALKIWMCIKHQGIDKFGRLIVQNIDQAKYLQLLVEETPNLEMIAPVSLNIACFRYNPGSKNNDSLNLLNNELLLQLQESGVAVVSSTVLHGKKALRAAITNHRTKRSDLKLMISKVIELGSELKDQY